MGACDLRTPQASSPTPRFISLAEAADMLGVTEKTIRRYIASGDLQAARLGRRVIRIREDHVAGLLQPIPTAGPGFATPQRTA